MLGLLRQFLPVAPKMPVYLPVETRRFSGASVGRLTNDWLASEIKINDDIRTHIKKLRSRARDLAKNDDYAKRYLTLLTSNVVGHAGISLQNKAKDANGKLDKMANDMIESAFKRWCKKGNCDVTGRYSMRDMLKQIVRQESIDGEIFVRKVRGYDNEFKFALQLISADKVDSDFNEKFKDGTVAVMGVHLSVWGKPIGYFFKTEKGHDYMSASDIIHIYEPLFDDAVRGISRFHTVLLRLYNLQQYEESELVASRIAAAKMGFYTRTADSGEYIEERDDEGNFVQEVSPGVFEVLPAGYDFKPFDVNHPTTAYESFVKGTLRGIASGLGISYFSLANDLTETNYSSARVGVLEDRSYYRDLQQFIIESFCQPVFEAWLLNCLVEGIIPLPVTKFDKFNAATWHPRGFAWVDPLKDVTANIKAIEAKLKSRTRVIAEEGIDIEELADEIAKENEILGVVNE